MVCATPLSKRASDAWCASNGRGVRELPPRYSPSIFARLITSPFTERRVPRHTRTFLVDTVHIHTAGRRPSVATIRTLRATAAVLTSVYGRYPQEKSMEVMLSDDPSPKRFPNSGHASVQHINSGFSAKSRIVITRCSEMHRTIIHEMVHVWRAHGRDFPAAQKLAHQLVLAPKGCLLTEAYVEAVTWLIHGGYCAEGLNPQYALSIAKAYLNMNDIGSTNAWAYIVGKALLVQDGGVKFYNAFIASGLRMTSELDHLRLVQIMHQATHHLGGPRLDRIPLPRPMRLVYCSCSLGHAYEPTQRDIASQARRTHSARHIDLSNRACLPNASS